MTTRRRIQRNRAQTTQNASFGPFVSFFLKFFCVLLLLTTVLGTIGLLEGRFDEIGPKRRVLRRLGH